ncbi:restriction modification system DNA specificity domain-containing protein [Bacteroides sp. CAG:633]|uniref:restriction endonuclease subunit S n=1 Tax=Bacteroides sp. CAG:633 TaxID=1262744 RepID=UPI00033F4E4D|nr:restriction endonuclease subunit S [Bacteroides sp. CAG:633]CDB11183.1 restriction modification system DNA specificity domain-containing protein [Bacteroides sp. CAG:633]
MEKENEIKTVVPALRFPAFRNTEGWKNDIVNNLVDIIIPPKKIALQEYLNEGDYPIIDQSQKYISGWINDKDAVFRDVSLNNPFIVFGDHTCILKKVSCPFVQGADGIKVLKSKDSIDGNFLYQALLVCPVTQEEYKRHFSILKQKKVFFPSIKSGEQQKIADCFSSLDDLIEATAQKVKALEKHKKGLMQRLFPAEGKNMPDLRFPEFQEKKEWKEKQLGNIGEIITGNTPSTKDITNYGGNKLFVSPADISNNRYVSDTKIKLTDKGFSVGRYIPANSVLFVCIGSTIGKVAQNKFECITNQQINSIVPYEEYLSDFIYSVLEHKASQIAMLAGQQAVPIINKTLFSSISILVPPQKEEQQKIANCLSSLDELIEATSRKVEILKEHKKGLMQQLFPKI